MKPTPTIDTTSVTPAAEAALKSPGPAPARRERLDPQGLNFRRCTELLLADRDRLASLVRLRIGDRQKDPSPATLELAEACLDAHLAYLNTGRLPDVLLPFASEASAPGLVEARLARLLGQLRAVHEVLWQAWFDLAGEVSRRTEAERKILLHQGSDRLFRSAQMLEDQAVAAHLSVAEPPSGATDARRLRSVQAVIDGEPLAGRSLDYDLDRYHLGVIAAGEDSIALARDLGRRLERPHLALASPERGVSWGWISSTRPLDRGAMAILGELRLSTGWIALGIEAFGEAGFRSTHLQAARASRLGVAHGLTVARFEDVAVEALAGESPDDARAFVRRELQDIDDESDVSRKLRETLAAYFAAEHNAASAAARLGIHQQTVANRLRVVEERLGRPLGERWLELGLALRLRSSLATNSPEPPEARAPVPEGS